MATKQTQPARKHMPVRTCVVCKSQSSKRMLTRIVRTEDGLVVDPSGKMNGRGAYLCDDPNCWERAVTTQILEKALRTKLTDQDRARLQQATPDHVPR